MKEYWNALRFGSSKTKLFLWTIILLSAGVIGCLLFAVIGGSLVSGILALFMGVLDIIVMQSASLKDQRLTKEAEAGKERPGKIGPGKEKEEDRTPEEDEVYSKEKLEKLFTAHKVKKNPRPVLIDSSITYHIMQCPAYIWKEKTNLHLLCLGKKRADEYTIPLSQIKDIVLRKGVPAREGQEYREIKETSFLNSMFGALLPNYYEMRKQNRYITCKNLYVIYPDIAFTNTSASVLLDVLQVGFRADDEILRSDRFDFYFKELYKYNLLWKDGAITLEEYKKQVQRIGRALSEAEPDMEKRRKKLEQMVAFRLITEEYANYLKDRASNSISHKEKPE